MTQMKPDGSVVAVIITHNRKNKLKECLRAVLSQKDAACDVIVIDNGSSDGTADMISDEFSSDVAQYFNTGCNFGSAGGFHLGVYAAVLLGYNLIWVMDDDVVPCETALAELLRIGCSLPGNWGYLSSVAYWRDGSPCKANVQKTGLFSFVGKGDYGKRFAEVKTAAMASLLLRADVVKEVGLPIAEYFIYTDDYEYTGRISSCYPCYMVPGSRVLHDMDRNSKANIVRDSPKRLERYRYLYRNDVHFYKRYGFCGWVYLAAKAAYTTANILVNEREDKGGKLTILWMSIFDGLSFNPEIVHVNHAHNGSKRS